MCTNDKLWAFAMAGFGTYVPGLEKLYTPNKHSVTITKLKKIKINLLEEGE